MASHLRSRVSVADFGDRRQVYLHELQTLETYLLPGLRPGQAAFSFPGEAREIPVRKISFSDIRLFSFNLSVAGRKPRPQMSSVAGAIASNYEPFKNIFLAGAINSCSL